MIQRFKSGDILICQTNCWWVSKPEEYVSNGTILLVIQELHREDSEIAYSKFLVILNDEFVVICLPSSQYHREWQKWERVPCLRL